MRGWGFVIEGVSIERRETLKTAKNGQKTHKIIKKFRVRLRISKKSSNFARFFDEIKDNRQRTIDNGRWTMDNGQKCIDR